MNHIPFKTIIRDREQVVFEGTILAISSKNSKGPFDILGHHSPFITSLQQQIILLLEDKSQKKFDTSYGIIHVSDKLVQVYIGL